MRHMKKVTAVLALILSMALITGASAACVPEHFVVENLNGQQRIVKTYTLSPETDPKALTEPDFEYDGYLYSWTFTTMEEHPYEETKEVTETVTVETSKKDLSTVLEQLEPTIEYEKDGYAGTLALDHTTIKTEAAGYTKKSSTITETKTIGPVDRNDMSYVPATTVKNGVTLTLSNVDWQIIGTGEVGGVLMPSAYQAVATYSAKSSYSVATGYISTAEYRGQVVSSGIKDITYTVVYTGTEIVPEEPPEPDGWFTPAGLRFLLPILGGLILAALLTALGVFLYRNRKNVYIYRPSSKVNEYKVIGKYKVSRSEAAVRLVDLDLKPGETIAVEIRKPLAKELAGQQFTVTHIYGDHTYTVLQAKNDWHEFTVESSNTTTEVQEDL